MLRAMETAFKPLRCIVEHSTLRQKIRLRMYSLNDEPILEVVEILSKKLRQPGYFPFIVGEIRTHLRVLGHELEPWEVPKGGGVERDT